MFCDPEEYWCDDVWTQRDCRIDLEHDRASQSASKTPIHCSQECDTHGRIAEKEFTQCRSARLFRLLPETSYDEATGCDIDENGGQERYRRILGGRERGARVTEHRQLLAPGIKADNVKTPNADLSQPKTDDGNQDGKPVGPNGKCSQAIDCVRAADGKRACNDEDDPNTLAINGNKILYEQELANKERRERSPCQEEANSGWT